ncbi:pyrroline-5-carboxylate reductase family protein [Bifidobacterium sp.]|jgi:pyrroline-5-carboxylate reductase|uniref:pyrroline-5-carboxylate reductase family protein n=1 Tax=Bifidobacterium sp. TaxID=41200 RepID=UPI0025BCFC1A|nr:pyrroline-5-carboxylate reductase dimerization domain-containing protein [Bifidobacterium sp.]MCI1636228.1 NAD(P)-binding domain-containing protein [Bifidobacterium sp.]
MAATLYFIGGGNMVTAIIEAIRKNSANYAVDALHVQEISQQRIEDLQQRFAVTAADPSSTPDADIVIIGIRPQDDLTTVLNSVAQRFDPARTTIVSIVAGYTIAQLEEHLGHDFGIARIIPNTLTTTDYGYSGVALNERATTEDVDAFLRNFGKPLYVEERLIDVITGFYPPNLVYHFIDAYVDAGVLAGLPRDIAKAIALDTVIGGTEFLKQKDVLPQVLLNINNSPGGVGITQAYTLNKAGFAAAVQSAVLAAVNRTTALGREAH